MFSPSLPLGALARLPGVYSQWHSLSGVPKCDKRGGIRFSGAAAPATALRLVMTYDFSAGPGGSAEAALELLGPGASRCPSDAGPLGCGRTKPKPLWGAGTAARPWLNIPRSLSSPQMGAVISCCRGKLNSYWLLSVAVNNYK